MDAIALRLGLLFPLGLGAGVLTTLAGLGGGQLLLLALATLVGPHEALLLSSPALLLGQLDRLVRYRTELDQRLAGRLALAALAGALAGGLVVAQVPDGVLRGVMIGSAAFAVARALGLPLPALGPAVLIPGTAVVGVLAAGGAGAAILVAPLLLGAGLTGRAYVGTASAIAASIHLGRLVAFAAAGSLEVGSLAGSALIAAGILLGNVLGDRARPFLGARVRVFEVGVLVGCVVLAFVLGA